LHTQQPPANKGAIALAIVATVVLMAAIGWMAYATYGVFT